MEKFSSYDSNEQTAVLEKGPDAVTVERFKELADQFSSFSSPDRDRLIKDWDVFERRWQEMSYDYDVCKELYSARKKWLEIVGYGEQFQHFFEEEIIKRMQEGSTAVTGRLYPKLAAYGLFGFKNTGPFLTTLLENPVVWDSPDGSNVHSILSFIKNDRCTESSEALVRYIRNMYREGYARVQYLPGDVSTALETLVGVVEPEEAFKLVQPFMDENPMFAGYVNSHRAIFAPRGYSTKEFDPSAKDVDIALEQERLNRLEDQLVEIRNNPRPRPHGMIDTDTGGGGWTDDWWDDELTGRERSGFVASIPEDPMFEIKGDVFKRTEKVNDLLLKGDVAPTAASAIQLHMYNYLSRRPDASEGDIQIEFDRINKLSEKETQYSEIKNPLPTIGIEIEVPERYLTPEKVAVLNLLAIKNKSEIDDLWEVNPDFSYSAGVQARIIQELAQLGALPIDYMTGKVNTRTPLSLHVNFGMPILPGEGRSPIDFVRYREKMNLLNDLLVYGYTSVERLRERKTNVSMKLSGGASKSKKDKNNVETKPGDRSDDNNIVRMELRATEFKDYPTFRMLSESQRLVSMLTSYIKYRQKMEMTFAEACLADLWSEFEAEVGQYLAEETSGSNIVDRNKHEVIEKLLTTDLKMWSRFLISDYSRKVAKILEEAVPIS